MSGGSSCVPPYGVPIQDAIASGDLAQMKQVADDAEGYIKELTDALEKLKKEIVRFEPDSQG